MGLTHLLHKRLADLSWYAGSMESSPLPVFCSTILCPRPRYSRSPHGPTGWLEYQPRGQGGGGTGITFHWATLCARESRKCHFAAEQLPKVLFVRKNGRMDTEYPPSASAMASCKSEPWRTSSSLRAWPHVPSLCLEHAALHGT